MGSIHGINSEISLDLIPLIPSQGSIARDQSGYLSRIDPVDPDQALFLILQRFCSEINSRDQFGYLAWIDPVDPESGINPGISAELMPLIPTRYVS